MQALWWGACSCDREKLLWQPEFTSGPQGAVEVRHPATFCRSPEPCSGRSNDRFTLEVARCSGRAVWSLQSFNKVPSYCTHTMDLPTMTAWSRQMRPPAQSTQVELRSTDAIAKGAKIRTQCIADGIDFRSRCEPDNQLRKFLVSEAELRANLRR